MLEVAILAHRGAFSGDGHRRSEVWRPAVRLVTACSGGTGPVRRALRPAPRGARCTSCGGNAADGSTDPEPKPPRWSAERRASRVMGRRAPRKRPVCRVASAFTRVFDALWQARRVPQHPGACRRSAHPSGWEFSFKTRAQPAAGTRCAVRTGLFDIVGTTPARMRIAFAMRGFKEPAHGAPCGVTRGGPNHYVRGR
jgi:hypothetical protein